MLCPFYRQCPPKSQIYTVKPGDTLYRIAKEFDTTVSAIISANPFINPYNLIPGQKICVPEQEIYPACPEGNYYFIKPGDTLYSISKRYNISLDDLVEGNPGIDPDLIFVGQVICIPLATPPIKCDANSLVYIIQKGDTFYSLAKKHSIRLDALIKSNPTINPDALLIGQKICIPKPWKEYSNTEFKVRFIYPALWKSIDPIRYEGIDGFFQVSAIAAKGTLDEICSIEATHKLMPYGSQPNITKITAAGHPACIITPSSDQPPEMKDQSALIIKYPKPVNIKGQSYDYFILWADLSHIKEIAASLSFIEI